MRKFYAIAWVYGRGVSNGQGVGIANVYEFDSAQQRNKWVELGPDYYTSSGFRARILAKQKDSYTGPVIPFDGVL